MQDKTTQGQEFQAEARMSPSTKKSWLPSLAGAALAVASGWMLGGGDVFGVDVATVMNQMRGNFGAVADLMGAGAYLAGAGFGIQAAFKFKAHNDNLQQTKLSQPIVLMLVSGALLALPSFLGVMTDTPFSGATATSINGNNLGR